MSGHRPPWWPEDREWPPNGGREWRDHGRRMMRRAGCAILLLLVVMGVTVAGLAWLLLSLTGVVSAAPLTRVLSAAGLLLGVGAMVLAGFAARRLARPATRLVEAARRIEAGDYTVRVPVHGPGELRTLARAFNAMTGRLEADEARRRTVIAEVAHELRTPIAVVRAQAEAIADGVYPPTASQVQPILTAARTLEVLVDDLGALALAEVGALQLRREPVEMAALIDDALGTVRETATAGGVRLDASVQPPDLVVDADPVRLRSVLTNLLGNAVRHTGPSGHVEVVARREAGGTVISVSDDGTGIDPGLLPRVFDRFVKSAASPGSGLGLAIVRDVVEAHGGTITAESEVGRGSRFVVRLPRSTPSAGA